MQVEIVGHDLLAIDANLEVLPRIGESFLGVTRHGEEVSGTVRDVEHSYNAARGEHSIRVYLKP
ncbi:hypothetical protein [Acinetobacter parvus]|uniref:Uncharacterized protein n=1 Tax=Acinetobacter parvus DSM 16617 = CIP 108168 TaxID=981333 RepID=N8QBV9_9GAMM|nr:hypothetical protein [Acinetobacter parvus]ENU36030.1 hypothetical protein F988_01781 [Acinetobacter parvus DSM 16617 = CIP 108168]